MIIEQYRVASTDTDLLAGGRLNTIPKNGRLTLRFLASASSNTNYATLTLQLPGGSVPIDAQRVVASSSGQVGSMNEREVFQVSFPAARGGHFVVSLTITGTCEVAVQAILR